MNKILPTLLILLIILGVSVVYILFRIYNAPANLSANLSIGELRQQERGGVGRQPAVIMPGQIQLQERQVRTQTIIERSEPAPQTYDPSYSPYYPNYPQIPQQPILNYVVHIRNFQFYPSELRVPPGTKITWINEDAVAHTATGGIIQSPTLQPGYTYEMTFSQRGTYDYICTLHPNMRGRIIVN